MIIETLKIIGAGVLFHGKIYVYIVTSVLVNKTVKKKINP
jgi:hypothetical protein